MNRYISSTALLFLAPMIVSASPPRQDPTVRDRLETLAGWCAEGLVPEDECLMRRTVLLNEALSGWSEPEVPDEPESADRSGIYDFVCNYDGSQDVPAEFESQFSELNYSESSTVAEAFSELIRYAGISPNFLVTAGRSPNATATFRESAQGPMRSIIYNPSWIANVRTDTGSNWAVYSVLAHEIGHHVEQHLVRRENSRQLELEADKYSGRLLAQAGATLAQATIALNTMTGEQGSSSHPGRAARVAAAEAGWREGRAEMERIADVLSVRETGPSSSVPTEGPQSQPTSQQPITPIPNITGQRITDSCQINGEQVAITASNTVLNTAMVQVGERIAPRVPQCAFELLSNAAPYCVYTNGAVFQAGLNQQVGYCRRL